MWHILYVPRDGVYYRHDSDPVKYPDAIVIFSTDYPMEAIFHSRRFNKKFAHLSLDAMRSYFAN